MATVPIRQGAVQSFTPSLPHAQLQFTGAGGWRDGAGPGRVEQGFDLAVGQVALLEHMALITGNEQE